MLSSKSPSIIVSILIFLFLGGCSAQKTDRGYLIRHESAWELNRTPWIGCPPDSHCDEGKSGFFDCLKKDSGNGKGCKKFRRHCGVTPDCLAKNPCCKTLGCGMWVDPCEPMVAGSPARACGLTPFCSPMKPCSLTPYCAKPGPVAPNALVLGNMGTMNGGFIPNTMSTPQPTLAPPTVPSQTPTKPPTIAGPNGMRIGTAPNRFPVPGGMLVSMGIVPGVSAIATGGLVAAAGVATPAGVMTPSGVLLPNGVLQSQGVIRACTSHPNCVAARPCGLAGCGMIVPVTTVSNNAMMLASALSAPGIAGNVMQAGGFPNQPVPGLSMNGTPQVGYPPIAGRTPWYPQHVQAPATEEEEEESVEVPTQPQSQMPAPRFHPVPSKPAFQRSEGLPTTPTQKRTVSGTGKVLTRETLNAALEQAYLEGIADAMDDVQEEIDAQNHELAKAELQARILRQTQQVQSQLEAQQEAKLRLQEESARQQAVLQAQYRQTHQAQLQQVALQQAAWQQPQLQQAPFQAVAQGTGKGGLAPPPNRGAHVVQSSIPQPRTNTNLLASTKAAGSGLMSMVSGTVSPLTELFSVGQPRLQPPQQYRHPIQNQQMAGMSNVSRSQPVQVAHATAAAPVRINSQKKLEKLPCPVDPYHGVGPSSPVAPMSDLEPLTDASVTPPRPTTVARKPKKVIDSDDDQETGAIQSAHFVVDGS